MPPVPIMAATSYGPTTVPGLRAGAKPLDVFGNLVRAANTSRETPIWRPILGMGKSPTRQDHLARIASTFQHTKSRTPEKAEIEFLDFLPAFNAWLSGDATATARLAETIGATSRRHAKGAAMMELGVGRITAAEKLVLQEETPTIPCEGCGSDREGDLALLAYFRGDRSALVAHLTAAKQNYGRQLPLVVWLSSNGEPVEDFERFFHDWSSRPDDGHSAGANSVWGNAVTADVRSRQGDTTAVADLERAVRDDDQTRPRSLRNAEALADALVRQGDLSKSAAVLEDATRVKTRVFCSLGGESFGGVFWLRLRANLAKIYRRMGRDDEANRVEAEVSNMLAHADPDFSLLR